jgi:hypothetical protein
MSEPNLLDLIRPEPGKARRDGAPTSKAAAYAVAPRTGTQRRRVLDAIAHRASTDEEIQAALRMSGNTERPRRVELVEGGWIRDSGARRKSSTGSASIVWALARAIPNQGAAA